MLAAEFMSMATMLPKGGFSSGNRAAPQILRKPMKS